MKRNSLFKGLTLSVALSAFLTGCGGTGVKAGGDDTTKDDPADSSRAAATISGNAIDGYLQYATVCLDLSQDGYCQAEEPNTQTDKDGKFSLQITPEISEDEKYENAMLLVYGGKDVDTGLDFNGKLLAPKDDSTVHITPITTLVAKAVQKEIKANDKLTKEQIKAKIEQSRKRVAQALGLDEKDIKKDPIAALKAGDDKIIQKALQLQKAVEALLVADDDKGRSKNERAEEIYEALLDGLSDMQTGDRGVEKLLEKTFERAKNNKKTRDLLGGDRGVEFAEAAKGIARNIKNGFEKFDQDERKKDDFLEKIGSITKGDLKKVKIAFEDGKLDEISGQIKIDDGIFKPGFDWTEKFILDDLDHVGLHKLPQNVIDKLKEIFKDKKVKPGVLFAGLERLKESDDPDIQKIYNAIRNFLAKQKEKKEQEDAKRDTKVINITPPMSFYMPQGMGYGKVTFNDDDTMSYEEFKVQKDGTFVLDESHDDNTDLILKDGKWVAENNTPKYKLLKDGAIQLSQWNEKAYIVSAKKIEGEKRELPEFGLETDMPKDAKAYFIKIDKIDDFYTINEQVRHFTPEGEITFSSISDFISKQCGVHWFIGDDKGGLGFAGEKTDNGYTCDASAKEGKLVQAYFNDQGEQQIGKIAGKWKIVNKGDIDILVVKPYNVKKFLERDEGIEYPIFAEKDGVVYRGSMEPKGLKRVIPAFNKSAMESIKKAIADNWDKVQKNFPSYPRGDENYDNQR